MKNRTRLPWLALAIVVLIAAGAEKGTSKPTFLDQLKPGQAVSLEEKEGRYEIGVFPKEIQPLSHNVVEIGQDYVLLRDLVGLTDLVVPIYSIKSIKVLRFSGK